MADLVAQGRDSRQRWRRRLPEDQSLVIGRAAGRWTTDWDPQISRKHIEIAWDGQRLGVRQLPESTNPVFFQGRQLAEFFVSPGEHFVIGQTRFSLVSDPVRVTMDLPSPDAQRHFTPDNLRSLEYRDAGQRIAVLAQLPDVISRSRSESDLFINIINVLLSGVRRANAVALL